MAQFLKLTNTGKHQGNQILINVDHITCIYEDAKEAGGSLSTFIYCANGNKHWVVEESYWEVRKMIEDMIKKGKE
jgi:hypothetical protein